MLKYFARLALILFVLPSNAQQILAGSIDFEIDTVTNDYTFYTTSYQRGLLNLTPGAILTGPVTVAQQLYSRDTIRFADCTEPIIKSIYKSPQPVQLSVPGSAGSTFVFSRCCNHSYENIPGALFSVTSLTIRSDWDSVNQVPIHPRVGTWSSAKPDLVSFRERGIPQTIQYSNLSVDQRLDSVISEIARPYSNAALMPQLYNNGFGVFAPFPDNTENLLNAPNTFSSGGFINFNVQPDGDTPKYYIYPVKFDSYHNGRLIASQLVNNSLVLLERNTQRGTPLVSLVKDSITQIVSANSQVFSYNVKVGDTLDIILRAVHPFQQSTLLTIDGRNLNQNHLNSTPLYSKASFTPQNGFNGTFHSTDSNFVLFRFIPLGNNYVLGPKLVKYNFNFSEGYCIYPERQEFKLRIGLSMDPAIGDEIGQLIVSDTLTLCVGDSVNVQSLGDSLNFRWEHPTLTNTALARQGEISFFPSANSWLYIGDSLGNRTDSVYLYFDIPPLVPIQRNLNSFSFNPNALGTTLRPDYWLYNGVLPLYSPVAITEIPIQGSGTYGWQIEDPRFNCARLSEVDTVIDDNIWGSLFEEIELVEGETYPDKIRVFLEVTSEKKIDSVYFLGFDPLASPMFTSRNQLVFFDLYEDNVKIAGSTNVFLGTTKIAFELGQILKPGKQYYFDFILDPDDVYNANDLSDVTYPLVHGDIIVSGVQMSTANTIGPSNSCPQIGFKFNESIGTREEALFQLAIYPNPAVDRIMVSMPNNTAAENFSIHDLKSKALIHGSVKHGQTIDISHLPKGIYYLILEQGLSQKIVKI